MADSEHKEGFSLTVNRHSADGTLYQAMWGLDRDAYEEFMKTLKQVFGSPIEVVIANDALEEGRAALAGRYLMEGLPE